jgi:hypothetical protein
MIRTTPRRFLALILFKVLKMRSCRDAGNGELDGELDGEHAGASFLWFREDPTFIYHAAGPLKILNLEIINAIFAI